MSSNPSHHEKTPALAPLGDSERLAWRLAVLGGFPLVLLLYGALRRTLA